MKHKPASIELDDYDIFIYCSRKMPQIMNIYHNSIYITNIIILYFSFILIINYIITFLTISQINPILYIFMFYIVIK